MDLFKVLGGHADKLNENGWSYVTQVMQNSTTKVGIYLLIFFLIFEIAKIFETANKNNEGTVVPITMFQASVNALLAGASIIIVVVVSLRTFQLYVYTILAPIAFSSFASSEYRSIGVGFAKQYCAKALQGFVILIILGLSNSFSAPDPKGAVAGGFVSLIQPIIVAVLILQSEKYAKSVVGLGG